MSQTHLNRTQAVLEYLKYVEVRALIHRIDSIRGTLGLGSLSVLSKCSHEGKTFFSAVLAAGIAQIDPQRRCLIVDASTPYPEPCTLLEETVGPLESVDIIRMGEKESGVGGGMLDETKLMDLLEKVQGQYHLVIVDTCALERKNRRILDPVLISRHTGGSLLISSQGSVGMVDVERDRRRLADAGVKLLGIVHNDGANRIRGASRGSDSEVRR